MMKVTLFARHTSTTGDVIPFESFITDVQSGKWKAEAEAIRQCTNKDQKRQLKSALPCVSASCYYTEEAKDRRSNYVHNGLICLDFDDVDDVEALMHRLRNDQYIYCAHKSVGGKGIAAYVKIDAGRHLDAFLSLQEYCFTQYQTPIDQACKDVVRLRYVSYDPAVYFNRDSVVWSRYLKEEKKKYRRTTYPMSAMRVWLRALLNGL